MSATRIFLLSLPCLCQELSNLMKILQSSDKNSFASSFWGTFYHSVGSLTEQNH